MSPTLNELQRRFGKRFRWTATALAVIQLLCTAAWAADLDFTKMVDFRGPLANQGIEGEIPDGDRRSTKLPRVPSPLPLDVTLMSISPSVVSRYTRPTVDILLRNTSKELLLIPASWDDLEVLRSGNQDQRVLSVYLRYAHQGAKKTLDLCVGVTVGSASVPGSMITLYPEETLSIHGVGLSTNLWLPHESGFEQPEGGMVNVSVVVREEFLEDTRVYMKSRSEAKSSGDTQIIWTR